MARIVGGFLSDPKVVSWFNFATPLYFASFISLFNAFLLWWLFHETFSRTEKIRIKLHHAINIFASAFRHEKIRDLSFVFLVMIFGWSNFFTFISMFVLKRYGFTPLMISLLLADLGVGFSIGCGFLVDFFVNRFLAKNVIVVTFFLASLGILIVVLTHKAAWVWALMTPIGASIAVGYSAILALFSDQVSENEQGWVMGVTGSILALCFGLTSFLTGYLANFGTSIPMYLAVVGIASGGIIMLLIPKKKFKKNSA